jgi:hypothetical protein
MAEGPYRHVEIKEVRPPAGVSFFANDEGLSVEIKRPLPLVAAGAGLAATVVGVVVTQDYGSIVGEVAVAAGLGSWWWPRLRRASRRTTLEIRGGTARFGETRLFSEEETTIPLARLGLPTIGQIVIERSRGPELRLQCLQFDRYVDGVRGGQSLPLQILAGDGKNRLEWLRKNISSWMRNVAGIS